jgi:hypothetical protein
MPSPDVVRIQTSTSSPKDLGVAHILFPLFTMYNFRSLVAVSILACQALAGDDKWLSPEYKQIFQNPLPFPPDKEKTSCVRLSSTSSSRF